MRKVAVIDADLIGRKKHSFPNLTCMKFSGWHKGHGDDVVLKMDYENLEEFDVVYVSKVFKDTPYPIDALRNKNVHYGGTGFYAPLRDKLPNDIEHYMPDYHLYDEYVAAQAAKGRNMKSYTDYSIGFLTRGCFRGCQFCVNKNSKEVREHSPLSEFLDEGRQKICLLDDNFLGCTKWKELLEGLIATGKRFVFKQGLDARLLTDEKCQMLFNAKYDGDYIFAFDDVEDYEPIEKKLQLIRKHTSTKNIKFYVLCGFDREGKYDTAFWLNDIHSIFVRIDLLAKYRAKPYLMRYEKAYKSKFSGMYTVLANWINYPPAFAKQSVNEFVAASIKQTNSYTRYLTEFKQEYPNLGRGWFNWKYEGR